MRVLAKKIKFFHPPFPGVERWDIDPQEVDRGIRDKSRRWVRRLFARDAREGVKERNRRR